MKEDPSGVFVPPCPEDDGGLMMDVPPAVFPPD
jgi:hypothetical protein